MTSSSRTYTGIILIFFGGSTLFGTRGQHAVNFPLMKQQAPRHIQTKTPYLACKEFIFLITPLPRDKNKKRGYPRLDRNILSYLKKAATYSPAL